MKPRFPLTLLFWIGLMSLWLGSAALLPATAQTRRVTPTTHSTPATRAVKGKRIALVIGNNDYAQGKLANPVNDAKAFATFLRSVAFDDVVLKTDLDYDDMKSAVETFGKKMKGAAVVVFYYSGHGMQVGDSNYLVPIDAKIQTEGDAIHHCVPLYDLMSEFSDADTPTNLIFLDACRDNPFLPKVRGGRRGLANINAPSGTLFCFATAPGKTASDNSDGKNGLFTQELLKQLENPNRLLTQVLTATRRAVKDLSKGEQVP